MTQSKYRLWHNLPKGWRAPVAAFIAGWDRYVHKPTLPPDETNGYGCMQSANRTFYFKGWTAASWHSRSRPLSDSLLDREILRHFPTIAKIEARHSMPIDFCCDCGTNKHVDMHNCHADGTRKPGFICINCWRAKHPTMKGVALPGDLPSTDYYVSRSIIPEFYLAALRQYALPLVLITLFILWALLWWLLAPY